MDAMPDSRFEPVAAIRVERMTPDQFPAFQTLFRCVFNRHISLARLRAKYDTAWTGKQWIGFIAYDPSSGEPVGSFQTLPVLFRRGDRYYMGAQAVDAMVHPAYRHRRIFSVLAQKTEALAIAEGIDFFFAFTNQNSRPAVQKALGVTTPIRMQSRMATVWTLPLEKVSRFNDLLYRAYGLYARWIASLFFQVSDRLPDDMGGGQTIHTLRSESYRQYKQHNGSTVWRWGTTFIWLNYHNGLQVGDMEAGSEAEALAMWSRLRKMAFWAGLTKVVFQATPEHPALKWLETQSESGSSWHIGIKSYNSSVALDPIRLVYGDTDNF